MADLTLTGLANRYPDGTTLYAYHDVGQIAGNYRPSGTAEASAAVSGRAATFTGLVEGRAYVVVGLVGGVWLWIRAHVAAVPELPAEHEPVLGRDLSVFEALVPFVVRHGAVATVSRPAGAAAVIWVGSVEPSDAIDGDIWLNTT